MAQAKQQIVKYQKGKHSFKVVCYPGSVLQYREGKLGISKVFQTDTIFTNVVRGDRASADDLRSCFGPDLSDNDILAKIVEEGEIEYSAAERKKFMDDKLNEIVYYIHKNWIDPKTKLPHPIERIKLAISGSKKKIQIDLKQDSKKQAQDIVKRLQGTIMFAKAIISSYKLTIKYTYDGKCKNLIHGIASNVKEDYNAEGCVYTIELTKGDMDSLMEALAKPTNGDYNLIEEGMISNDNNLTSPRDDGGNNGKNKGEKRGKKKKKQSSKHGKRGQEIAEAQLKARENNNNNGIMASARDDSNNNNNNESKTNDGNNDNNNNGKNHSQEKPGKKRKKKKKGDNNNSNESSEQSGSTQSEMSNQTMASASSGDSGRNKRKRKGKKDKNRQ